MRAAKIAILVLLAVSMVHVASPYAAAWRMWNAALSGDSDTLAGLIDWDAVRTGIKEDIAEGIVGMPAHEVAASNTLVPFGSSFMSGIAGNIVDRDLTPEHMAIALRALQKTGGFSGRITKAWFSWPDRFEIALRMPGQADEDPPLRVEMRWHSPLEKGWGWQIVRAWVPQDLMEQADFGG
jgi:hypothetical protein